MPAGRLAGQPGGPAAVAHLVLCGAAPRLHQDAPVHSTRMPHHTPPLPNNSPPPWLPPAALCQTHHPLPTAILNEVSGSERWADLRSVLEAHPNVRLLLTGHFHKVWKAEAVGAEGGGMGLGWSMPALLLHAQLPPCQGSMPQPCPFNLQGLDWGDTFPFPTRALPAVRYSPQNYFILDLHPDGTFRCGRHGLLGCMCIFARAGLRVTQGPLFA